MALERSARKPRVEVSDNDRTLAVMELLKTSNNGKVLPSEYISVAKKFNVSTSPLRKWVRANWRTFGLFRSS
jgi:galactokinase